MKARVKESNPVYNPNNISDVEVRCTDIPIKENRIQHFTPEGARNIAKELRELAAKLEATAKKVSTGNILRSPVKEVDEDAAEWETWNKEDLGK